jgi:Tol biopolymer transport system component
MDIHIRNPYPWLAWSPDSRLLAYQGVDGVDVLDPRTGRSRRLTKETGFAFAWSPDGRLLAYIQGNGLSGSLSEHRCSNGVLPISCRDSSPGRSARSGRAAAHTSRRA